MSPRAEKTGSVKDGTPRLEAALRWCARRCAQAQQTPAGTFLCIDLDPRGFTRLTSNLTSLYEMRVLVEAARRLLIRCRKKRVGAGQ